MTPAPLDHSPAALRRRFADAFVASRPVYWADLLASTALGWAAFVASGHLASALASVVALAIALFALYRAVLFIHELTHLRSGAVPGFAAAWNLLAGFPLMVPSIMYVGSHVDHHKRSTYGTPLDPEYEPMAYWSPLRILASTLVMPIVPAAVAARWGVIGPLSWLIPPLRPFVVRHLSTLVINPFYRRAAPRGRLARRWRLEELGAALAFWLAAAAFASGALGLDWLARWYVVTSGILVLNHLRTLAAHRYEGRGQTLSVGEQLADTWNVEGIPGLTALLAPVGLRYHGLHHVVPSLPYHSLGRVHRTLLAELPADSPYRRSEATSIASALRSLLEAASRHARSGAGAQALLDFRRASVSAARAGAGAAAGSERRNGSGAAAGAR